MRRVYQQIVCVCGQTLDVKREGAKKNLQQTVTSETIRENGTVRRTRQNWPRSTPVLTDTRALSQFPLENSFPFVAHSVEKLSCTSKGSAHLIETWRASVCFVSIICMNGNYYPSPSWPCSPPLLHGDHPPRTQLMTWTNLKCFGCIVDIQARWHFLQGTKRPTWRNWASEKMLERIFWSPTEGEKEEICSLSLLYPFSSPPPPPSLSSCLLIFIFHYPSFIDNVHWEATRFARDGSEEEKVKRSPPFGCEQEKKGSRTNPWKRAACAGTGGTFGTFE
jgi:hypothetical protein